MGEGNYILGTARTLGSRDTLSRLSKSFAFFLFVTLFLTANVSAASFDWQSPVDVSAGEQLKQYSTSPQDLYFKVDVSDTSTGTVTLQEKTSGSQTFTDVVSSTYRSEWGTAPVILGSSENFTVQNGQSKTVSIDGNEATYNILDISGEEVTYELDGASKVENTGEIHSLYGQEIQLDETFTGEEISQQNQIATGTWWNLTIDGTDHSIYLGSIVDDDNTIYAEVDGNGANYDEGDRFTLSGKDVEVTDVIPTGSGEGETQFTVYDETQEVRFKIYSSVNVGEDYWQYRANFDSTDYSDSIYFSVGKGHNIPYVDYTEVSGERINDYDTTQDVTTNTDVYANVKDNADDAVNVTLYDSNDQKIGEIQQSSDSKTLFATLIAEIFSLGEVSREDYYFTTASADLLSQENTGYGYYFEVEDLNDGATRTTPVYQLNTGTSTNQAPNITAVEGYDGSSWKSLENFNDYGEFVNKVRVKVDDPDNDFHQGYLNVKNDYDDKTLLGNTSNPVNGSEWDYLDSNNNLIWNTSSTDFSRILDSGNWTATVQVTDYNTDSSKSDTWSVSWGHYEETSYTVCGETGEVEMNQSDTCQAEVVAECVGGECSEYDPANGVNENTTVTLDPKPVKENDATSNVKSSREQNLLSLEYWRSWIQEVFQ